MTRAKDLFALALVCAALAALAYDVPLLVGVMFGAAL